jgi:hypothetical protein
MATSWRHDATKTHTTVRFHLSQEVKKKKKKKKRAGADALSNIS